MSGPRLKREQIRTSHQAFSGNLSPGMRGHLSQVTEAERAKVLNGTKLQWTPHDGKGAQARRMRQRLRAEAKARKSQFGVEVDAEGRTPAGLIVP